jgi:hypothetical protein
MTRIVANGPDRERDLRVTFLSSSRTPIIFMKKQGHDSLMKSRNANEFNEGTISYAGQSIFTHKQHVDEK